MAKSRQKVRPSRPIQTVVTAVPVPALRLHKLQGRRDGLICLGLIVLIALAYWPVARNEFINFDDDGYVRENEYVNQGLSAEGVKWAFTSMTREANWHPLTWISHMIDCQLFKLEPAGHHLMNVAFHLLNTVLLYLILLRMTGAMWPSAAVAALFGVHPLHVESVAWVAERKDVLSTLFGLAAVWAWLSYVARPRLWRYLVVMLWYAASLMSKPMLVTLPLLLLLLDWWPLGRIERQKGSKGERERTPNVALVLEKLPLAALAAASCVATYLAQAQGHAVVSFGRLSILARLANIALAYCGYLRRLFVPIGLAPIYPLPNAQNYWLAYACWMLLAAVTFLAVWFYRRQYLAAGWFWYLGLLVPVIGVVQVGRQSMADRYTYLPAVGIFIILSWSVAEVVALWPRLARPMAAIAIAVVGGCCLLTNAQVRRWQSTKTLFEHTVAVTGENPVALTNLGLVAINENREDDAERLLHEALQLDPQEMDAWGNLANLYRKEKNYDGALKAYLWIDKLCPNNPKCLSQLGSTLAEMKQYERAEYFYRKALEQEPGSVAHRFELAKVLDIEHKQAEALQLYLFVLERHPEYVTLRNNAAWICATSGDPRLRDGPKAVALLEAVPADKRDGNFLDTLAAAYAAAGRFEEAVATAKQAIAKSQEVKADTSAIADMEKRLASYEKREAYTQ